MEPVKTPTRRTYRSTVRQESARRTRQRIVQAAAGLFAERGYAATSLDTVATAAGVARPTVVAAYGSKPALLRVVLDQALAGDDEPVPVAQRPWFAPVWDAESGAAALDAYAGVCRLIGSRAARLFEAVRRAADSSDDTAALWGELQLNRRAGAEMVVEHVRRLGPLRRPLTRRTATDALWVLNDPGLYLALVVDSGWGEPSFQRWLSGQMRHALLPG